jgi:ubiquinone biosynthesis protein
MREALVAMVVSIGMRDSDAVARLLYRVGIPEERVLLHKLRDRIASLFDKYMRGRKAFAQMKPSQLLADLFEIAAQFKIRIPSEFALVARAGITLEGVIRKLDPELEAIEMLSPMVKKLMEERFTLPKLGDQTLRNLLLARDMWRELPMMASQILMDLEAGKMRLQMDAPKLDTVARNIDLLGITLFLGMIACAFIMGAFYLLANYYFIWRGILILPTIAMLIASTIIGGVFGRYFLAGRLRKFSLGRLLRRKKFGR